MNDMLTFLQTRESCLSKFNSLSIVIPGRSSDSSVLKENHCRSQNHGAVLVRVDDRAVCIIPLLSELRAVCTSQGRQDHSHSRTTARRLRMHKVSYP